MLAMMMMCVEMTVKARMIQIKKSTHFSEACVELTISSAI